MALKQSLQQRLLQKLSPQQATKSSSSPKYNLLPILIFLADNKVENIHRIKSDFFIFIFRIYSL